MNNALIIFEDNNCTDFYPLTYMRPVYFLRAGIRNQFEKIFGNFEGYKPFLFCRPEIAELTAEQTKFPVNSFKDENFDELIFINGRLRINKDFADAVKRAGKNAILYSGQDIAAFKMIDKPKPDEIAMLNEGDLGQFLEKLKTRAQTLEIELPMYNYLWDFVAAIDGEIEEDFEYFKKQPDSNGFLKDGEKYTSHGLPVNGVEVLSPGNMFISPDADIMPGVVLDATDGPIFIGSKVKIEPNSYIIGPTYIGKDSMVVGGKIAKSSVGSVCRIGGEVEASIIQGYSNKYHAGFIGHSYLGEWINLGAMTTNSDLKNNYSKVKSSVNGDLLDTGSLKIGSFIGDYTRTSIGTLLNTGINIGIVCNIVANGLVIDREISPFTWYQFENKSLYNIVRAEETLEEMMRRRQVEMTIPQKKRLEELFNTEKQKKEDKEELADN